LRFPWSRRFEAAAENRKRTNGSTWRIHDAALLFGFAFSGMTGSGHETGDRFNIRIRDMLVLSRRTGEKLLIGNDIIVTVVETHGGRVRLGIEAAAHVPILREEVKRRIESSGPADGTTPHRASRQSRFFPEFA
jgi:carbon storage regulator CsrA